MKTAKPVVDILRRPAPGSWEAELITTKDGSAKALLANACLFLRNSPEWKGVLGHNDFSMMTVLMRPPPWGGRGRQFPCNWSDVDDRLTAEWLQLHGVHVPVSTAADAVQTVVDEHRFHPVRSYLQGLKWDGKARSDAWLSTYIGVPDSEYSRAVGRRFVIQAVARIFQPGCKADCCLILEGRQGLKKSTALRVLGGLWFTDEIANLGSKDSEMQMRGVWIIELSELSGMTHSDVDRTKAFMGRSEDRFRPPYGRNLINAPRQCVFAGTVNRDEYLQDETGGRRFWPVKCGDAIQIDALQKDRDQLWAEAVTLFRGGEKWWLETDELIAVAEDEQEARYEGDPWLDPIAKWLRDEQKEVTTVAEILRQCVKKEPGTWTKGDSVRTGRCLAYLKWKRRQVGSRGSRTWRYESPDRRDEEA